MKREDVIKILEGLKQEPPANMIMAEFNKKIEREIECLKKLPYLRK